MRSYGNLWPRVTSFENLYQSFLLASKGKRSRPDVAAFEFDLEGNLLALQQELSDETYQPGGYHNFLIHEPARRKVSAAPFRDRVVHHGLCRVIEPLFDRTLLPHSFANRTGRGTHRAMDRCRSLVRQHPYVLKADITKFFPSVDHAILFELLARRLRCQPTRRLIRKILDSGAGILAEEYEITWFPGDTLFTPVERARGLPIGNLTSQFWANVYLHELDRFVVQKLGWDAYLRYVDDFVLFADRKDVLHNLRRQIHAFLPALRLTLHPRKTRVLPVTLRRALSRVRSLPRADSAQARGGGAVQAPNAPTPPRLRDGWPVGRPADGVGAELDRSRGVRTDLPASLGRLG